MANPQKTIDKIYTFLNIPSFNHSFINLDQFRINEIMYDDGVIGSPLHKIRTDKILKHIHKLDFYLPKCIIDMERSPTRHSVDPLNLKESPDYVYIYCVDVEPNSCEFVMEYDDNRRVNRTWHIPLQTNQFIIFPSTQRYFITKNKSSNMNVFLTTTAEYL